MFKQKDYSFPFSIRQKESLLIRLPPDHPARNHIEEDLRIAYAGYHGERSLLYHLNFVEQDYHFFHDLRLPWKNGYHFQIDILLLSPACMIILEVKNIAGELFFDQKAEQLIRTKDSTKEAFPYPITQLERHIFQLQQFLHRHQLPPLPIIPFVVSAKSSSVLATDSNHDFLFDSVVRSANLPFKINKLKTAYTQNILSTSQLEKLSYLLLESHTPFIQNQLRKYNISVTDLMTGVLCDHCYGTQMHRVRGYWTCPHCGSRNADAHIQALADFCLINQQITNQQFRNFTHLDSISIASKLLSSLHLRYSGTYKNRSYFLDIDRLSNRLGL